MFRRPFYETIKNEREKMKGPRPQEILKIIEEKAAGPKSKEILKKSLKYESPAHIYYTLFECPPVVVKGLGAKVWDADGIEYLDMMSGFAVHNIGYGRPEVVETIRDACEKLIQYCELPHQSRAELAQKLVEITPGKHEKKVYYGVTGGEAVEVGMKFARYYTGRPMILSFYGGYHGRTFGAMNATSNAYMRYFQGFPLDIGVVHVPFAYCYRCVFGKTYPACDMQCTRYVEELLSSPQYGISYTGEEVKVSSVAAILVEPMQAHAGYISPPKEFLQNLRKIADEHEMLLMIDEIQTGWARSGRLWACELSEVTPDIMTVAKSVAAGIPMSAVIARSEIMDELGPAAHSTTFGGIPLAATVALVVIDIIMRERLWERARKMGDRFMKGWRELAEKYKIIGDVNGRGLFIGIELVEDKKTKEPAAKKNKILQMECFKRGLLYERAGYYGNRINLMPPLAIDEKEIDKSIEIFDQSLKAVGK